MQHYHYNLSELDDMIPFEREIYVGLLIQWIDKEMERLKNQQK